jgi:hypothetical protein
MPIDYDRLLPIAPELLSSRYVKRTTGGRNNFLDRMVQHGETDYLQPGQLWLGNGSNGEGSYLKMHCQVHKHDYYLRPSNYRHGAQDRNGCRRCRCEATGAAQKAKAGHTHESMVEALRARGIRPLTTYEGMAHSVMGKMINKTGQFGCLTCNNEWKARWTNVFNQCSGCPACAKTGFDPSKPGFLYYIHLVVDNLPLWKIGITNLSIQKRFCAADRAKFITEKLAKFDLGREAHRLEQQILNQFRTFRYAGPPVLESAGNTELFTTDVLQGTSFSSLF